MTRFHIREKLMLFSVLIVLSITSSMIILQEDRELDF